MTFGSATRALRLFTTSPWAVPCQPQCHGRPIWWTVFPSMRKGRIRRVTSARASISPRAVRIVTYSPFRIPRSAASSGEISQKSSGINSASQGSQRLITPLR